MSIDELVKHLNAEIEAQGLNWLTEKVGNIVFIYGPNRNRINSDNLAIISFFRTPPMLQISGEGKEHEKTIVDMWEKYMASQSSYNQPKGGPGEGVLGDQYTTPSIVFIAGFAFLCLAAAVWGSYLFFSLFQR